jgi:hypothetical protein
LTKIERHDRSSWKLASVFVGALLHKGGFLQFILRTCTNLDMNTACNPPSAILMILINQVAFTDRIRLPEKPDLASGKQPWILYP